MDSLFFEGLDRDDSLRKHAAHSAVRLANLRVRSQFRTFLAQAPSRQERKSRFQLIKDDLNQVVVSTCEEVGHDDVDSVRKSVIYSLMSSLDERAEVDLERLSMGNQGPGNEGEINVPSEVMNPTWEQTLNYKAPEAHPASDAVMRLMQQQPGIALTDISRELASQGFSEDEVNSAIQSLQQYYGPYKDDIGGGPYADDVGGANPQSEQLESSWTRENPELDSSRRPLGKQTRKQARRPQMCPFHKEVVDISLTTGDPRAGFQDMGSHWGGGQHCQGGDYSGPKCNFRREMTTQKFWDDRDQMLEDRRNEREQEEALQDSVTDRFEPANNVPEGTSLLDDHSDSDISDSLSEAPSAVSEPEPTLAAYKDDEGSERPGERAVFKPGEDDAGQALDDDAFRSMRCPRCGDQVSAGKDSCRQCGWERGDSAPDDDSAKDNKDDKKKSAWRFADRWHFGDAPGKDGDTVFKNEDVERPEGPVPEMDKKRWEPTALNGDSGGNLHPIDTDTGTKHPGEWQDKHTAPDWKADFKEQTDAASHQEPATTDTSVDSEDVTSWENNGTNPVTQSAFPSDSVIKAAIRRYES